MSIQEIAKLTHLSVSGAYKLLRRLGSDPNFHASLALAKRLKLKPYYTSADFAREQDCCRNTAIKLMRQFPITMNGARIIVLLTHLHGAR